MRFKLKTSGGLYVVLILVVLLGGCSDSGRQETSPETGVASRSSEDHEHDHEHDEHGHHHVPPHGGTLVELGDHVAHLEFLLDANTGTLTAYTFDVGAETAVRIQTGAIDLQITPDGADNPIKLTLRGVANSLTGETTDDTAEFAVTHEALKNLARFDGTVPAITIRGATFQDVQFSFPDGNE